QNLPINATEPLIMLNGFLFLRLAKYVTKLKELMN
ncbi:hypothetical protein BMETH_311911062060, partial [methanotrophic bacterial endosymbiont of Bathymodiolus sp.]